MKTIIALFILLSSYQHASTFIDFSELASDKIVTSTKQIKLDNFPDAHNPSIIKFHDNFLLIFRYIPYLESEPHISYIGVVLLNDSFDVISEPQLLRTRTEKDKIPSQAEDARVFSYRGRMFLIYNDNMDTEAPATWERRDMFIAELYYDGDRFSLSSPLKLVHEEKYNKQLWQKNWLPFEWNRLLLISYYLNPHEILYPNLKDGTCYICHQTSSDLEWNLGQMRGSTPPQLVDGEYLAFFHSGIRAFSSVSFEYELWHLFMGAYTFSAEPPFNITKMTPEPIVGEDFYTPSFYGKRVIYPGGYVISGSSLIVAYGKDDSEIWIATIDKEALKKALVPVNPSR